MLNTTVRTCKHCAESKSTTEFYKYRKSECKVCLRQRSTRWYANNKEHAQALIKNYAQTPNGKSKAFFATIKYKYGVTKEEWLDQLERQQNKCAICSAEFNPGVWTTCATDHNHVTGEFRGLLCQPCNSMLGYAKEHPETLRTGAAYLEALNGN